MDIIQQLTNTGVKVTKHKIEILKLFYQHKHLDANLIQEILIKQDQAIGIATIYRTLNNLESANIIVKHNFNSNLAVYELNQQNEQHGHMICNNCNSITEFSTTSIEQEQQKIVQQNNFQILNYNLIIYGICAKCQ